MKKKKKDKVLYRCSWVEADTETPGLATCTTVHASLTPSQNKRYKSLKKRKGQLMASEYAVKCCETNGRLTKLRIFVRRSSTRKTFTPWHEAKRRMSNNKITHEPTAK